MVRSLGFNAAFTFTDLCRGDAKAWGLFLFLYCYTDFYLYLHWFVVENWILVGSLPGGKTKK